jgi:hypothetical protein
LPDRNQAADLVKTDSLRAVGPGFTESAAIERGIEIISEQLLNRVLKPML